MFTLQQDGEVKISTFVVQGFVVSDWEGIDRITDPPKSDYNYSVLTSISAGLDMVSVAFSIKPTCDLRH